MFAVVCRRAELGLGQTVSKKFFLLGKKHSLNPRSSCQGGRGDDKHVHNQVYTGHVQSRTIISEGKVQAAGRD